MVALTEGRGADVVIVACSFTQAQEQALSLAGKGGSINFFGGFPLHQSNVFIDSNVIHRREISVQGSHGSISDDTAEALKVLARNFFGIWRPYHLYLSSRFY